MNHEQIEAVVAVFRESATLTEIELQSATARVRLRRPSGRPRVMSAPPVGTKSIGEPAVAARTAMNGGRAESSVKAPGLSAVTAMVVGLFRTRGIAINSGDSVKAGQILGHIETIGLLSDCVSPIAGTVARVATEDGQPVEYGQLLFEIEPHLP